MHPLAAVILAAGQGTRMLSDLPKVVHEAGGLPMVCWVVRACAGAGCGRVVVVVGYERERVRAAVERDAASLDDVPVEFAVQHEQLGTGHAVQCARPALEGFKGDILVLCGDGPLVRAETLEGLVEAHRSAGAAATLATAKIADPSGYGRIVRDARGAFAGIVEEKHATPAQKKISEVNPSHYCFTADALWRALARVGRNEKSGEFYLTDAPALLMGGGERVQAVALASAEEALSVNTPEQLAAADRILRARQVAARAAG
jgi:bifunctional UDP-N-acetylglucosamine pyrophosphorylase/glucosamine-1-phosphate N-acetyltransferase